MNWPEFVSHLQLDFAILSLILNSILIILIAQKSPSELGSYRHLMSYIAIFEMLFSIIDYFLSPVILSHDSMFLIIIPIKYSEYLTKSQYLMIECVWCGCIGSFMAFFAIQFIYRFCVVNNSKKVLKSFDDHRLFFWMLIPILTGIAWGNNVYFLMGPTTEKDSAIHDLLLEKLDLHLKNVTYIGPRCYETSDENYVIKVYHKAIISIIISLIISCTSLIFVIIFALKTFLKFRETFQMISKQENNLQLQTFYALVSQTIIPMILMHFPCTIVLISTVSDFNLGHISSIASVTFALFPALDPLPVMLIIKNYRGTLLNFVATPVAIFVRRKILI
ncbi:unnamed protein product [Caenorhabditis angaria]|uniref:Seven TM Receptor n=1 Tax=Caenorhabditis angaria TaxID=860376 RepID=A0A9P1IJ28_9PELO|nr:unnamed protein product [Caenorhabditis angaria]